MRITFLYTKATAARCDSIVLLLQDSPHDVATMCIPDEESVARLEREADCIVVCDFDDALEARLTAFVYSIPPHLRQRICVATTSERSSEHWADCLSPERRTPAATLLDLFNRS